MLVLLPTKVGGLGDLEAELTAEDLTTWTANLSSHICLSMTRTILSIHNP
jgi:hypothetical protein